MALLEWVQAPSFTPRPRRLVRSGRQPLKLVTRVQLPSRLPRLHRLEIRTEAFQASDAGLTPAGATKGEWFNGRMTVSKTVGVGSIPTSPANRGRRIEGLFLSCKQGMRVRVPPAPPSLGGETGKRAVLKTQSFGSVGSSPTPGTSKLRGDPWLRRACSPRTE